MRKTQANTFYVRETATVNEKKTPCSLQYKHSQECESILSVRFASCLLLIEGLAKATYLQLIGIFALGER